MHECRTTPPPTHVLERLGLTRAFLFWRIYKGTSLSSPHRDLRVRDGERYLVVRRNETAAEMGRSRVTVARTLVDLIDTGWLLEWGDASGLCKMYRPSDAAVKFVESPPRLNGRAGLREEKPAVYCVEGEWRGDVEDLRRVFHEAVRARVRGYSNEVADSVFDLLMDEEAAAARRKRGSWNPEVVWRRLEKGFRRRYATASNWKYDCLWVLVGRTLGRSERHRRSTSEAAHRKMSLKAADLLRRAELSVEKYVAGCADAPPCAVADEMFSPDAVDKYIKEMCYEV